MKKLLTLLTLAVATLTASADPVDAVRARQIAADFLGQDNALTLVKKAQRTPAKARRLSQATAQTSPYYIYSRGTGRGFIIVSGDDCMPSILGYTEQGDFDESNMPEALQDMLTVWAQTVEDAQLSGTNTPKQEAKQRRAAADRSNISPLMTSHWHQSSPYNDRCPYLTGTTNRAATGCVATAASQILYYWRKDLPSTLQATTPTYSYGDAPVTESIPKGTELRWDLMKDSYTGGESATVKNAVAEFVFATGAATWLTYGSSTAGNIENIPYTFSTYYGMNGGTVHYRNSNSQEGWVQLLYNELLAGRPVMYTGVHPSNGGHAVVVHGYQKTNDLFYFNFGWGAGNGYDGYYTVDTETGMNGFYDYQSALIGALPKAWNMNVSLKAPATVYSQRTNSFEVTIDNNSTLSQSGFYLFAATSSTKPSALKNAKDQNTEVVIPSGSSATFTLSCKPTSTKTWYITLTDANLNVLQQIEVTPQVVAAELSLVDLVANGSADVETIDGQAYCKFYSDKAVVSAEMHNEGDVNYEGTGKLAIYAYDEENSQWAEIGTKSASNIVIPAGGNSVLTFNVTNTSSCPIEAGKRYYAEVSSPWGTVGAKDSINTEGARTARVYFVVTGESDFDVASFEDGVLSFSGHWDRYQFDTKVKTKTYATATAYDLTQVEVFAGTVNNSLFPCPNALVYLPASASSPSPNTVSAEGICQNLQLTAGQSFTPKADFQAWNGELTLGTDIACWYLVTTPFTAAVPDGIYARRIEKHTSSGFSNKNVTDVDTLEAGHTYLVMASAYRNLVFRSIDGAKSFHVAGAPAVNADTAIVGTYTTAAVPTGAMLMDMEATQYFNPATDGAEAEGLRGYFYDTAISKKIRVNANATTDPAYATLAQDIQLAYDILEAYQDSTTAEAYAAYADSIHAAEHAFTHRAETGWTTASPIKKYAANLLALGETYKQSRQSEGPAFDADGNGVFDLADIRLLISLYLSGNTESIPAGCDVDGDGRITLSDITAILGEYLK